MRPQDLTTAKTVAKISVVSNTAGGKKSVARRSTGLDYSSLVWTRARPVCEPLPSVTDGSIGSPFLPSATKTPPTGPSRAPLRSRS
jgi:hypothetical protein